MKRRTRRLKDFERRAAYSPSSVYLHAVRGWRYIPIHPFADDPQPILHRAGTAAGDCRSVDAYWEGDGDIYFLQVAGNQSDPVSAMELAGPHLSARRQDAHRRVTHASLVAKLPVALVSRGSFEAVMTAFADAAVVAPPGQRLRLSVEWLNVKGPPTQLLP